MEKEPILSRKDLLNQVIDKKNLNIKVRDENSLESDLPFGMLKDLSKNKAYYPSETDMDKINSIALMTLMPDQVRVFTFQSADLVTDRGKERFSREALNTMATLAVKNRIPFIADGGKDHEWAIKNVKGMVFDASVDEAGNLLYKVYIPIIEKTKPILEAIMTGIYNKLSVGFAIDPEDYVCDSCNKSMFYMDCPHSPGQVLEDGTEVTATIKNVIDNFEISGVAVPMQPAAHIRQSSFSGYLQADHESTFVYNGDYKADKAKTTFDDKINNDTSTIEDKVPMSVKKTEEVKETKEVQVAAETTAEVVETPEVAATEPEIEVEKSEVTVDEPQAVDTPVENKEAENHLVKILEQLEAGTKAMETFQAQVQEKLAAQDEKINQLLSKVEEVNKSVEAATIGSFDEAKTLVEEKSTVSFKQEDGWFKSYLSEANLS